MKKVSEDLKYLFWLWGLLIVGLIISYAHHGHLLLDCGREVYYPVQILKGKLLYKDLFVIYGPFSYMFNAFLFKVFSIKLNVLYNMGCICAFAVTSFIYLIGKRFLPKFLSFAIAFFTLLLGIWTIHLFNLVFPYSFAMLYGITAFLASVYFLLRYAKEPEKIYNLYTASLFAGLCIANKYEFLLFAAVIVFAIFRVKKLKASEIYYSIFSLVFFPIFCFGILFIQGVTFQDLFSTLDILKKMSESQTLHFFYSSQGVYFHKNTIVFLFFNLIKTLFPLACFYLAFKLNKNVFKWILIPFSIYLMFIWLNPVSYAFVPVATFIFAAIMFKELKENIELSILALSALIIGMKVFWGLATMSYGLFFIGFLLIALISMIHKKFEQKNIDYKAIGMYFLIASLILGFQNILKIKAKHFLINSKRGGIYTTGHLYNSSAELIDYINNNTKKTDKVVIFPEGTFINYLTERDSDDFYNSLIPLYVEVFGDEKLIEHFKKTKPEYIIFSNWDTSDYYLKYICNDYAVQFCNFVAENYTQEKTIDNGLRFLVFKKK